jgi:hypothetical protein
MFKFLLEKCESPPSNLGRVSDAIGIERSAFEEVTDKSVGLIRGFAPVPVQRLAGMVLFVADPRDFSDSSQSVREVIQATAGDGYGFACFGVRWQHA